MASCAISFVISLYLILHTCVQTFDVTWILGGGEGTKQGLRLQVFSLSSSHQIFGHMHGVLNVDKKNN